MNERINEKGVERVGKKKQTQRPCFLKVSANERYLFIQLGKDSSGRLHRQELDGECGHDLEKQTGPELQDRVRPYKAGTGTVNSFLGVKFYFGE